MSGSTVLGRLEDDRHSATQTRVGDKESITHRRSRGQSRWIQLEGDRGIGRQRHAKEGTYRCGDGESRRTMGRWGLIGILGQKEGERG